MSDSFVPLDMSAVYNAGVGNVEAEDGKLWPAPDDAPDHTPLVGLPWGEQPFWGVPFRLAAAGAAKAVVLVAQKAGGAVSASAEIPINAKARRILYAHACAPVPGASPTVEGTGEEIGTYRVLYADGRFVEQRLRRRFEIHDVQVPWGHHPFLCRNCRHFHSVPLDSREHGYGMVQTGAFTREGSDLQGWWLYDWENPAPDEEIAAVVVSAASPTALALAGLTLCHEEGDPFAWAARQEVALRVDAEGVPEVAMERGEIVRRDQLWVPSADFLSSAEAGWGRGSGETVAGGYLEIHGSAAGQLAIKAGDDIEERVCWGEVLKEKKVAQGKVRIEVVAPTGKQWVHVRVEDADTGQPVGTRVHFRSEHGAYLAPHGHQADVNVAWFEDMGGDCKTGGVPYAYIDGTCQIDLPIGPVYAEVVRGFEYQPLRQRVEIKPGQRALTLKIKRAFDMKQRGYYSGDTHVHFLSSQSAHLEAEGEDLNVVHLLASQWGRLFTSWEEFTGGLAPTSSDNHLVWVSQENRQHVLGHISLLGLKELVAPICTGGASEDWVGGSVDALMADWAEECKKQGGLVVMPHIPLPDFENAANIVLGHADAGEMCWIWQGEQISSAERGYYRWLNVGQKLPLVGGTDKMSNGRILGGSRTYIKLRAGEEFTFDNWCQAVRRGQAFASTGAMIDLQVEGREMGEEIHLPGTGGTVEVVARAESVWPLTGLELICNGESVAREVAAPAARQIELRFKLKAERSCWVAARCWGPHHTDAGPVMAHSSPIYIDVGRCCAFVPAEGHYLLTHLEGGIAWAERMGVFRDEAIRQRLIGLFNEARGELLRRMQ